MKFLLFLFTLTLSINFTFSQVTEKEKDLKTQSADSIDGWKLNGVFNVNFSQAYFKNWTAGGIESFGITGLSSFNFNYKKDKTSWENSLDLGLGYVFQGKGKNKSKIKTDDKIDFASKFGRKVKEKIYWALLLNFKSQFTDGFDYATDSTNRISKFLAPGYLVTALGIDYKPVKSLSIFLAPITAKFTMVNDEILSNAGAFGIDSTKTIKSELGGYAKIVYNKEIMKNVNLLTKLDLFSNYLNKPECIDVNWEVLLTFKVNKYISASISTQLLYDDDIKNNEEKTGPVTQFKEVLGIGLTVNF